MSSYVDELIAKAKEYGLDEPDKIYDCLDAASAGVEIIEKLEAKNKRLAKLVRAAPWVKTFAGSDWYKKAEKVIDMVKEER